MILPLYMMKLFWKVYADMRYVTSPIPFDKLKNSEMVLRVEETNFTVVASDISIKYLGELIYDRIKHPKSFLKYFKVLNNILHSCKYGELKVMNYHFPIV